MKEDLADRLFNSLSEKVRNLVVDVVVLPDFTATHDDDAMKIQVVLGGLPADITVASATPVPPMFEGHPVELSIDADSLAPSAPKAVSSEGGRYHAMLRPGIACGGRGTTNGTLGAIVFDRKNDGAPCILSNWHVLRGARRIGGRTTDIYQPGKLIGGTPSTNIVATYMREAGGNIDAAIATLNASRPFDTKVLLTDVTLTGVRLPQPGDIVEKSGSRTEVTRGKIQRLSGNRAWLVPVDGDRPGSPDISKSGDSGSVWYYPETGEAAVLHTYGDPENAQDREWAGGFLMTAVAEALDISMVPV